MIIKMNLILGVALMLAKISLITADIYTEYQLITALKNEDYNAVSELSKKVNNKDHPQRFNEVISDYLKHDFDSINLEKLVKYFATHDNKEERIHGYTTIFHELRNRKQLYKNVLVNLAFGLKDLLKNDLSSEVNDAANQLKDALPKSVRNLAFASKVCIINANQNSYLTLKDPIATIQDPTKSRRIAYARKPAVPGGTVTDSFWIIEPYGDVFHVKNYDRNEYLYAGVDWQVLEEYYRRIYTWIPGGYEDDNDQFQWSFESNGDFVRIKNRSYKEYLLITNAPWHKSKVFTNRNYENSDYLWSIEDCSQNNK